MANQNIDIQLADLATTFGLPATRFERELALLGWGVIINEVNEPHERQDTVSPLR